MQLRNKFTLSGAMQQHDKSTPELWAGAMRQRDKRNRPKKIQKMLIIKQATRSKLPRVS